MATSLPTGTVTFLFTDIEGSTKIATEHPNAWEALRARHHRILRSAIETQNGYVFQIIGDAFCAAFHRPGDAIRAATQVQRDLHAEAWHEAVIRVRVGIYTGEAETNGTEYYGYLTLSSTQRVMCAAHAGQVLVSQTAFDIVKDDLPDGVVLRDLGEHRLKDLRRPEHLYQLVIAGVPSDFPPVKALDVQPNNLPIQLTSFVGREREISDLSSLIRQTRLVTLTGVGGTGKTRLALQLAASMLDEFKDGVWLVELAPQSDPALVPQAIATALKVREQPGCPLLDALKDYLSRQSLLLVLDNCEHLIDACGQTADALLHAAAQLRILATSREALGIAGESIFPVRSLPLPGSSSLSARAVTQYDAVSLFVDRAVAAQPDFRVTDQNASAITEICMRLDGIPLALELAAARVKGLSVEQIASRIHDRFRLLTGGSRTALPRQRTLQAAIDWSYRLLSVDERALMRRLSVFTGGWTLEAAESVCAGDGLASGQILDLQLRLIDKSLMVAQTQASEPRYRMLETIRQYAQEKLDEAGEAEQVRSRHLNFFLDLAQRAEPEFIGRNAPSWLNRMDEDSDNLCAALDYALLSGHPESALGLIGAAFWLWLFRGHYSEGQRLAEAALAGSAGMSTGARAKTLAGLGFFAFEQSDYSAARDTWEQSLVIWSELNDKWWCALIMSWLGNAVLSEDRAKAFELLRAAVRLAREVNDPWVLAGCLWLLGANEFEQGNLAEARKMLEESIGLVRAIGDPLLPDEILLALGEVAEAEKDYPRALRLYEESRTWALNTDDPIFAAYFNLDLGRVLQITGDNDQAAHLFREALQVSLRLGKKATLVEALAALGVVAEARGDASRAVRLLSAGDSLYNRLATKVSSTPCQRPWLERHLASARAELGEERFAALRIEGESMTPEEAVQYALEGTQEA